MLRFLKLLITLAIPSLAVFALWYWNTVPSGTFEARWKAGREPPFIGGFGPADSIDNKGGEFRITGSRATFMVRLPQLMDAQELDVDLQLENRGAPRVVLEGKTGPGKWDTALYELFPSKARTRTVPKKIGPGAARPRVYQTSLRGSHTLWLLPAKDGSGKIEFTFQDMNRHPGADPIRIMAGDGDRVLKDVTYPDTEDAERGSPGAIRAIPFLLPSSSGPIKLTVSASDDIFIRKLMTDASRLVFEEHIFLGDDIGYGGSSNRPVLWSGGRMLSARTPHREGRQRVTFAGRTLEVRRSGEEVGLSLSGTSAGIIPIRLERNDVELAGDDFFALSPDDYFVPVESAGNTEEVEVAGFKLKELMPEGDGSYRFFISLPRVRESGGSIIIKSIHVSAR